LLISLLITCQDSTTYSIQIAILVEELCNGAAIDFVIINSAKAILSLPLGAQTSEVVANDVMDYPETEAAEEVSEREQLIQSYFEVEISAVIDKVHITELGKVTWEDRQSTGPYREILKG
jgi:hypothetical protein